MSMVYKVFRWLVKLWEASLGSVVGPTPHQSGHKGGVDIYTSSELYVDGMSMVYCRWSFVGE